MIEITGHFEPGAKMRSPRDENKQMVELRKLPPAEQFKNLHPELPKFSPQGLHASQYNRSISEITGRRCNWRDIKNISPEENQQMVEFTDKCLCKKAHIVASGQVKGR